LRTDRLAEHPDPDQWRPSNSGRPFGVATEADVLPARIPSPELGTDASESAEGGAAASDEGEGESTEAESTPQRQQQLLNEAAAEAATDEPWQDMFPTAASWSEDALLAATALDTALWAYENGNVPLRYEETLQAMRAVAALFRKRVGLNPQQVEIEAVSSLLDTFDTLGQPTKNDLKRAMNEVGLIHTVVRLLDSPFLGDADRCRAARVLGSCAVVSPGSDGSGLAEGDPYVVRATQILAAQLGRQPVDAIARSSAEALSSLIRSGEPAVGHDIFLRLACMNPDTLLAPFGDLHELYLQTAAELVVRVRADWAARGSASSSDAPPPVPHAHTASSSSSSATDTPRPAMLTARKEKALKLSIAELKLQRHETESTLHAALETVAARFGCNWLSSDMEANRPEVAAAVAKQLLDTDELGIATLYTHALYSWARTLAAGLACRQVLGLAPPPPKPVVNPNDLALALEHSIVKEGTLAHKVTAHEWNVLASLAASPVGKRVLHMLSASVSDGADRPVISALRNWQLTAPSAGELLPGWQAVLEEHLVVRGAFGATYACYMLLYGDDLEFLKWGTTKAGIERLRQHAETLSMKQKRQPQLLLWLPGDASTTGFQTEVRITNFLTEVGGAAAQARLDLLGFEGPVGYQQPGDLGKSVENLRLHTSVDLLSLCRAFQDDMACSRRSAVADAGARVHTISPIAEALRRCAPSSNS